jgi:hypothetical protein
VQRRWPVVFSTERKRGQGRAEGKRISAHTHTVKMREVSGSVDCIVDYVADSVGDSAVDFTIDSTTDSDIQTDSMDATMK